MRASESRKKRRLILTTAWYMQESSCETCERSSWRKQMFHLSHYVWSVMMYNEVISVLTRSTLREITLARMRRWWSSSSDGIWWMKQILQIALIDTRVLEYQLRRIHHTTSAYEVKCDHEHHHGCYLLHHPDEVCQRALSAIEEASSVCHETNTSNSRGTPWSNAHLGANRCQICHFPAAQ
jgi:hypothetical protein